MATKAKEKKTGIKLVGLEVQNLYKINLAELEFSPEGGVIEITGLNKSGKTSLLKSFMALVGGGRAIDEDPRNDDGKEDGVSSRVFGRFSNGFRITRRPTASNPKGNLLIEGPDGGKYQQGDVDPWIGNSAFDLHGLKAYATKPEKLVPILLGASGDKDLPLKLRVLREMRADLEKERSPWISGKQRAERARRPDGERPEPVEVTAEVERLAKFQATLDRRYGLEKSWEKAKRELDAAGGAVTEQEKRVEELQRALTRAHEELEEKEALLEVAETHENRTLEEWEEIPDPTNDIAAVKARISEADSINRALEPWKEWDRAQNDVEEARKKIDGYNDDLAQLRKEERKLLTENCPDVPGLSFDDDGLPLLHGKTLDKASGREWVEFTAAVAFSEDPELRVALVDEAEGVDQEGMEALHALSKEKDFQVLVCRIHATGVGEVVVCEDGRAWKEEAGKLS